MTLIVVTKVGAELEQPEAAWQYLRANQPDLRLGVARAADHVAFRQAEERDLTEGYGEHTLSDLHITE